MPSVKSTRLRRSGIRKIFRNFSSMFAYPLQGVCRHSNLFNCQSYLRKARHVVSDITGYRPPRNEAFLVLAHGFGSLLLQFRLRRIRNHRSAKKYRLAAGFLDLLNRRLGKLVRVDGEGRSQLPGAEDLDQGLLARREADLDVIVLADLAQVEAVDACRKPVQVHDCVFGPEDIGKAALGDRKSTRLNSSHLVISYAVF